LHWAANDRRCSLEINSLDSLAQIVAAADEVAEVLARPFGLGPDLASLLFLELELLDVPLQTNTNVVSRALERAANLGTDA
jgi:hypothetical protein